MKKGYYGGGTIGLPSGFGGGLYADNYGNLYPQLYFGSTGASISGGYTSDLDGLLTGPSVAGTFGRVGAGPNFGTSGGANGFGFGTPGAGMTFGFGPYNIKDIGESFRPRFDEFGQPFSWADTQSPPGAGSGNQDFAPAQRNPVLEFLDSFRPRTDEFGNPFPGNNPTAVSPSSIGTGSQDVAPAQRNPVLRFLDSFRPTTDEFGNP